MVSTAMYTYIGVQFWCPFHWESMNMSPYIRTQFLCVGVLVYCLHFCSALFCSVSVLNVGIGSMYFTYLLCASLIHIMTDILMSPID